MKSKEIVLGNVVRDVLTGYKGIASSKVEMLGGNVQLCIQPQIDECQEKMVYPDAMNLDHHTLDFVSDGIANRTTAPIPITVQLGDKIRDTVTGLEGIATVRYTYMNGCRYYNLQPHSVVDKQSGITGVPESHHLNQARLEVTKPLVVDIPVAKPTTAGRVPGGPATKAMRQT